MTKANSSNPAQEAYKGLLQFAEEPDVETKARISKSIKTHSGKALRLPVASLEDRQDHEIIKFLKDNFIDMAAIVASVKAMGLVRLRLNGIIFMDLPERLERVLQPASFQARVRAVAQRASDRQVTEAEMKQIHRVFMYLPKLEVQGDAEIIVSGLEEKYHL